LLFLRTVRPPSALPYSRVSLLIGKQGVANAKC
jgi:hypothetical protein